MIMGAKGDSLTPGRTVSGDFHSLPADYGAGDGEFRYSAGRR